MEKKKRAGKRMPRESNDLTAVIPRWSNYYSQKFYFLLCIFPYILNQNNKKEKRNEPPDISVFAVSRDSSFIPVQIGGHQHCVI